MTEERSLVVTTTDDVVDAFDNETSLREAVAFANDTAGADTITFAADGQGTIRLTEGEITITDALTGNGGAGVFQFRASDRNDTIADFRQGHWGAILRSAEH